MTQLEDRLRAALDKLAATVPPSENPAAEQNRRRLAAARSRRRRPMTAATAAAVVIAGVVAPSAFNHRGSTVDDSVPTPAQVTNPTGGAPGPDDPYLSRIGDPVELARFTEGGTNWSAAAFVDRMVATGGWTYRLCVVAVPAGEPVNSPNRHPNSAGCTPVPSWPAGQPPSKVETRSVLGAGKRPADGPLPKLLLFVTAPEVSRVDARAGDGTAVPVTEILRIPETAVFLADFGHTYEGFGYDARDSAGRVVQSGIT
jgi:hypothetical protein